VAKKGSLSKEQFRLLRKIHVRYYREAEKCASARAYYAACIMIGGAFEAMLLQICDLFADEVVEVLEKLPRNLKPKGSIDNWRLDGLIRVAVVAGWLPPRREFDEPGIGELADLIRRLRNLAHPGVHLREMSEVPLRAIHYRVAYEIVNSAREWLWNKFAPGLPKEPNRSQFGPPERIVVKSPRRRKNAGRRRK
jgi:hypothetical protein